MEKIKIPSTYNYIATFLTMDCNLSCSFCLNAFDKQFNRKNYEELSGAEWVAALNKIESRPEVPITFCGGEPSLHKDFIPIINNVKKDLNIDILTNLYWGKKGIEDFVSKVDPKRFDRGAPYASIRTSYHPEQMGNGELLVKNAKTLKENGFNVGIWSVLYPSPEQLSAITQMQFRCKDAGIEFRVKDYVGDYKGEYYGDYSKYEGATDSAIFKRCDCKISELLIAPNGNVHKCHRDLYANELEIGNITDANFHLEDKFRTCENYGQCHPCDVKVKTNYKQEIGHTSVEIKNLKEISFS